MALFKFRTLALALSLTGLAGAGIATGIQAQTQTGSITLYNEVDLQGAPVTILNDVSNLDSVPATQGIWGTANDYAFSLRTQGRWMVCMDADYKTDCVEVDGEVRNLGSRAGSISSVRFLGPSGSMTQAASTTTAPRQFNSTEGPVSFTQLGDATRGTYDHNNGRIEGHLKDRVLTGYWYQSSSGRACRNSRGGTRYWGKLRFVFDAGLNGWTGQWAYCDDAVGSGSDWSGSATTLASAGTGQIATAAYQPAAAQEWLPMFEVDLFGNDYRSIAYDRPGSTWQTCKASCDADSGCQAWTYVEPGRSPYGECFLKSPVPEASPSSCCISGIKGAPSTPTGDRGVSGNSGGLNRIGTRAEEAIVDETGNAVERTIRRGLGGILGN